MTLDKDQFTPLTWKDKDSMPAFEECIANTKVANSKERLLLLWTLTLGINSPLEDLHALVDRANASSPPCRPEFKEVVRVLHGLDIEKNERERSMPDYEMSMAARKRESLAKVRQSGSWLAVS